MFGLFKKTNSEIDELYRIINKALVDEGVGKESAEHLFQRDDLQELLNLGKSTATAAELALLWRQSTMAERMLEHAPFNDIVEEYIEIADKKNVSVEEVIEEECGGYIEAAKGYGERLAGLLDSGAITNDQSVREFCADHAASMLAYWIRYRLKMTGALMDIRGESKVDTESDELNGDLSEEDEEKYIKTAQLVQFKCQMAESSLENIDDSGSEMDVYEKERAEKMIKICLEHAEDIEDEFYRSTALHSIADLVSKSGQFDRAQKIIDCIDVDFIQEKALETLRSERKSNLSKL